MHAHLDCFAGICGNMFLGALVGAGVAFDELQVAVAGLGLTGYRLTCAPARRAGIAATHVGVACDAAPGHRHLRDCLAIVDRSSLPAPVKQAAAQVFVRLAEAEAAVHGTTVDEVHFHEVGAVDALVDIAGTCWGLHRLGVEELTHGPVNVGDGQVICEHGTYPVPPPAVASLLTGRPTLRGLPGHPEVGELTTPTGAALLATLARPLAAGTPLTVARTAYGAGDRDPEGFANCLRLHLLAADGGPSREAIVELVCDLDDLNPECLPAAVAAARAAGAVDCTLQPITTKAGRPATRLLALAPPPAADRVEGALFRHTTTFGVRRRQLTRASLSRRWVTVTTRFGAVRLKEGWWGEERLQASPEYRDCLARAQHHGVPVQEVYRAALAAVPPPTTPPTAAEDLAQRRAMAAGTGEPGQDQDSPPSATD